MTQTYDAILIGAGVMGASLAFHLAERGVKTAILERRVSASGATGHSSGLVRMHYDLAAESELTFASYKNYFSNWRERVGGDCGFINTGFLQIAKREHEDKLRGNVANQQRIGINTSVISAAEVKELFPDLITDHFDYAAYEPDSGYADATLTTNSFLEAAKRNGASLDQNCEVTAIRASGGRVTGVSTTKGDFDAPIVINAAGAWAKQVASLADIEVPLETWTHDVAFLHRPPSLGKFPAAIDDVINCYFRPEGSALILAAGEDESLRGEPPDAEDQTPTPTFLEKTDRPDDPAYSKDRRERLALHPRRARRHHTRPARHLRRLGTGRLLSRLRVERHRFQDLARGGRQFGRVDPRRRAQDRGHHALPLRTLRRRETDRRRIRVRAYLEVDPFIGIKRRIDSNDNANTIRMGRWSGCL